MYIIVDDRNIVAGGYANGFDREGVSSAGIEASEFREWIGKISDSDMNAVEAFVIGDCNEREALSRLIRERSSAPVLCLNERHSLDDTLCLFAAGADDVLRKPVHVREIVARVGAINRRVFGEKGNVTIGELRVYFDGREPEVNGEPFPLPRRERRILEFLCAAAGGASARRKSSTLSTASSTRMSTRTSSRATSANCARSSSIGWLSTQSIPSGFSAIASRNRGLDRIALNRISKTLKAVRKSALFLDQICSRCIVAETRPRSP